MEHIKEKPVQPGQIANITPSPPSDGFPHSSVGKESACNAGDPGSSPVLGRSPGEGIGYPLQYSWASLVAQLVKNSPTMQETWVGKMGRSYGEGKGYPLQYPRLENSIDYTVAKSWTQLSYFHSLHFRMESS